MFKWKRIVALMLVLVVAGGAVFAMGDKEAGKDDTPKTVIVYSSVDEANAKKILDAFTAETGITARAPRLRGSRRNPPIRRLTYGSALRARTMSSPRKRG
jgi:spermidine/putrescine-binding protein